MDYVIHAIQSISPAYFLYCVYVLNFLISLGIIFFDHKSPTATLAWIMIMFILPVVGLVFYLVFSQNIARKQIYKMNAREQAESEFILDLNRRQMQEKFHDSTNPSLQKWKEMALLNAEYAHSVLTYNDDVELICDGKEMFSRLCEDIRKARYTVKLEYYILQDDDTGNTLIRLLTEKAREGVSVKLMIDAMGSRNISERDLKEFSEAGGKYTFFFRPMIRNIYINFNYRNHRKMVIIDNEIGYIGGFNIGNEYLGLKKKFGYWRDTQLIIRGNALVTLNYNFYRDWKYSTGESSINSVEQSIRYSYKEKRGNIPIQIVSCGPESPKEEIKRAMMKMITGAKKNIYIQTPYLVPDEPMLESLAMAASSGIDVRIMIPCMPDHPFVYRTTLYNAGKLIAEGAKIYIYNNGFLHAKTLSVDSEVCTTGSANFDIRSFRLNFEANAIIYDENFTERFDDQFIKDLDYSSEYTAEDRNKVGRWERFLESISRLLTEIL